MRTCVRLCDEASALRLSGETLFEQRLANGEEKEMRQWMRWKIHRDERMRQE